MRWAQIVDSTVVNVILWDGQTDLGLDGELLNVDDTPCGPGWTYDGTTFTAPPPQPESDDE